MRIKKLQKELKEKNLDLVIIFSLDEKPNTNMIYLTDYQGIGVLAVTQNKINLLVPEMECEKAQKTDLKVYKTDKKKRILENLSMLLKRLKIEKVGIEENKCSVYLYKKLKKAIKARYTDVSTELSKLRMIKDNQEVRYIQKACQITDGVFKKICSKFNFKTEKEIKEFIKEQIYKKGADLAFPPIVASGKSTSQPHYDSLGKIKRGFLMLDFGAKYKGYCSDMTRMIYIGKPRNKEMEDYALVLKTLNSCEQAVENKHNYSKLYEFAIKTMGDKAQYFTHALGHGLGLDIHEIPSLSLEDKNIIQNNVVFTIEPGIYFPNRYGIRIEDTVIIQNKKLKILTKSKKDLVIIK